MKTPPASEHDSENKDCNLWSYCTCPPKPVELNTEDEVDEYVGAKPLEPSKELPKRTSCPICWRTSEVMNMEKDCPFCEPSQELNVPKGEDTCKEHGKMDCMKCFYTTQPFIPNEAVGGAEEWEKIKTDLFELDEMEFASNRDFIFRKVDTLLQEAEKATLERVKSIVEGKKRFHNGLECARGHCIHTLSDLITSLEDIKSKEK